MSTTFGSALRTTDASCFCLKKLNVCMKSIYPQSSLAALSHEYEYMKRSYLFCIHIHDCYFTSCLLTTPDSNLLFRNKLLNQQGSRFKPELF